MNGSDCSFRCPISRFWAAFLGSYLRRHTRLTFPFIFRDLIVTIFTNLILNEMERTFQFKFLQHHFDV